MVVQSSGSSERSVVCVDSVMLCAPYYLVFDNQLDVVYIGEVYVPIIVDTSDQRQSRE